MAQSTITKMTTLELEIGLIKHLDHRQNLIVPNVSDWSGLLYFETDILMLSKSGYATGFELKVSKSDLKNDIKKNHIKNLDRIMYNGKTAFNYYYQPLKHFNYVVPVELKESALQQIPEFCGLYIAENNKYMAGKIDFDRIKKPRVLYKTKWSDQQRYNLARLGSMRILNLKERVLSHS